MGARLAYAKVVDRQLFYSRGGRVSPGLESDVVIDDVPGTTAAFLVLRAWTDDEGTFTESWHIESPQGSVLYRGSPREIHLPTRTHVEELTDEVTDLQIDYEGDDYRAAFFVDDHEVARATFPVRIGDEPHLEA